MTLELFNRHVSCGSTTTLPGPCRPAGSSPAIMPPELPPRSLPPPLNSSSDERHRPYTHRCFLGVIVGVLGTQHTLQPNRECFSTNDKHLGGATREVGVDPLGFGRRRRMNPNADTCGPLTRRVRDAVRCMIRWLESTHRRLIARWSRRNCPGLLDYYVERPRWASARATPPSVAPSLPDHDDDRLLAACRTRV